MTGQVPIRELRTVVGGYETRELSVEGAGPRVVMIHGYGDSADTWRPLLQRLGAAGRAGVAVDLPGFGRASPLKRGALLPQWDEFAASFVRRVATRDRRDVVVAGNSLGGLLTLRLTQDPDLPILAAIPIAPGGLDKPSWFGLLTGDVIVRRFLALPIPLPRRVIAVLVGQVFLRLAFARPKSIDPAVVATFSEHLPDRAAVAGLLDIGRTLVGEVAPGALAIDRIERPLLVIWGEQDRMVSPGGAQVLREAVADTTVANLPDCGHCPQLEAPDEVARLTVKFLRRCERAASKHAQSAA